MKPMLSLLSLALLASCARQAQQPQTVITEPVSKRELVATSFELPTQQAEEPATVLTVNEYARALVHEPRLVVCDEPTAALDARSGRRVMDLLRVVAVAPDRACIIVTHDNRIFDLADRIIVLEDGRITHDGKEMPDGH